MIRPPPSLFVPSEGCDPHIIVNNFSCRACWSGIFGDEAFQHVASCCVFSSYIIVSQSFLQHGLFFLCESLCFALARILSLLALKSMQIILRMNTYMHLYVHTYSTWDLFCVRGYGCRGCSYYFVLICVRQVTSLYDR